MMFTEHLSSRVGFWRPVVTHLLLQVREPEVQSRQDAPVVQWSIGPSGKLYCPSLGFQPTWRNGIRRKAVLLHAPYPKCAAQACLGDSHMKILVRECSCAGDGDQKGYNELGWAAVLPPFQTWGFPALGTDTEMFTRAGLLELPPCFSWTPLTSSGWFCLQEAGLPLVHLSLTLSW
jgi:hypothetical protein